MSQDLPKENCFKCKGNILLCAPHRCPMKTKISELEPIKQQLSGKTSLDGFIPPSFFVGSSNWPKLTINPMLTILNQPPDLADEPDVWKVNYSISDIVKFRSHLVRASAGRLDVKSINDNRYAHQRKILETSQELLLTQTPTQTNLEILKPLKMDLGFSTYTSPMGPVSEIKKLNLEENPKINYKIDRIVNDTDNKATNAVIELANQSLSVTQIHRIFSAGMLGTKKNRRVVPTRWAITATDDIIARKLIEKVRELNVIDHYEVWRSDYLDNHFRILFRPFEWSFEFLEVWKLTEYNNASVKESSYGIGHDFEFYEGRTNYAASSQGGYYAARLAILEFLVNKLRKQAEVIVWREVGDDYYIPLGVWQVRENVRNAFNSNNVIYSGNDSSLALRYSFQDFRIPLKILTSKSVLLRRKFRKKRLSAFL